jgi:hypothetical protein
LQRLFMDCQAQTGILGGQGERKIGAYEPAAAGD